MKFRIHYDKKYSDDSFEIEAETIEDIRKKAFEELEKRNIDLTKTSCWSEQIS